MVNNNNNNTNNNIAFKNKSLAGFNRGNYNHPKNFG